MFETVKFDASNNIQNANFNNTVSLTVGSNNNRMVVFCFTANNSSVTITSLTFAGLSMTYVLQRYTNNMSVVIAYLLNPPVGTNDLYYTVSGSQNHLASITSFYNVKQSDVVATSRDTGVSSGSYTGAVTVPDYGLFVDAISADAQQVINPSAGQTLLTRANGSYGSMGHSYRIFTTDSGSYTSSWDNSTFQNTTVYGEAVFYPVTRQGGAFLYNLI